MAAAVAEDLVLDSGVVVDVVDVEAGESSPAASPAASYSASLSRTAICRRQVEQLLLACTRRGR